jgi:hypothetical protein
VPVEPDLLPLLVAPRLLVCASSSMHFKMLL